MEPPLFLTSLVGSGGFWTQKSAVDPTKLLLSTFTSGEKYLATRGHGTMASDWKKHGA